MTVVQESELPFPHSAEADPMARPRSMSREVILFLENALVEADELTMALLARWF
jgi:hypothetical protein